MIPEQEKNLEKLATAVETSYASPDRMFWRGLLWGLGRGVGNVIGFLLLLAVLFYVAKASGLTHTFSDLVDSVTKIASSFNSLPQPR